MGRRAGAEMRRPRMPHMPGRRVPSKVARIGEDRVGVMGGVVLGQTVMRRVGRGVV